MSSQFNVEIPKPIAERIRADARRSGRSLNAVATAIFKDFLDGWSAAERARFYETTSPKRAGRPLSKKEAA